jgi:1,6-anhydro-N-acetylmuramate kinase
VYFPEVEPVLEATYRLLSESDSVSPEDVITEMGEGTDADHVRRALAQLYRDDYISGQDVEEYPWPIRIEATEKGLQEAAGWPREGASREAEAQAFLRLLDERIADQATTEEERGLLRQIREGAIGVGTKVIGEVLARYLIHMTRGNAP